MSYDVKNLSRSVLNDILLVLEKIKSRSEFCGRKSFLLYRVGALKGVDKDDQTAIISMLINQGTIRETYLVSFFSDNHYLLHINDKFFEFLNKVRFQLSGIGKTGKQAVSKAVKILGLTGKSKWENITIKFKNEYDVGITAGNITYPSDCEEMGFADRRKKSEQDIGAKKSWSTLIFFSRNRGVFPLGSLDNSQKVVLKKQKQELSKLLKAYFQIKGDPITHNKEKNEYRMRIKLIQEETEQYQDRNIFENS
jgi:hypothetical protein